jgi:hypothetical protein
MNKSNIGMNDANIYQLRRWWEKYTSYEADASLNANAVLNDDDRSK